MAKILFPRNIQKGIFASMSFTIGPFTVTLIQLLLLAVGVAGFLGVFQLMANNGFSRVPAILMGLPVLLLFIFIAFFKVSELTLVPYLAKLIRTYFLDSAEKFQVNYPKDNPVDLVIKKQKYKVQERKVKKTKERIKEKGLEKMSKSGLL